MTLIISHSLGGAKKEGKGRERSEREIDGGRDRYSRVDKSSHQDSDHHVKQEVLNKHKRPALAELVNVGWCVGAERRGPFHLQLPETPIMYSVGDSLPPSLPLSLHRSLPPSLRHACCLNKTAFIPLSKLCKNVPLIPPTCGPTLAVGSRLLTVLNHFCMTRTYKMLLEGIRKDGRCCQKQQRWWNVNTVQRNAHPGRFEPRGSRGKHVCTQRACTSYAWNHINVRIKVTMRSRRRNGVIGDITIARVGPLITGTETTLADEMIVFVIARKQKSGIKLTFIGSLLCSRMSDVFWIPTKTWMCASLWTKITGMSAEGHHQVTWNNTALSTHTHTLHRGRKGKKSSEHKFTQSSSMALGEDWVRVEILYGCCFNQSSSTKILQGSSSLNPLRSLKVIRLHSCPKSLIATLLLYWDTPIMSSLQELQLQHRIIWSLINITHTALRALLIAGNPVQTLCQI